MPSTNTFERQDEAYRQSVLPARSRARRRRGRRARLLVALRGTRGPHRRHRHFGAICAREGAVRALRVHGRERHAVHREARCQARVLHSNYRREAIMTIKVGINGYGRIGRNILRALYESEAHRRNTDRRHQRPGRREDQCPPDQVRHSARPLPQRGARGWRCDGRERRPHPRARAARPVQAAMGRARRRRRAGVHRACSPARPRRPRIWPAAPRRC